MGTMFSDQEYFGSSFISITEPDFSIRSTKKQVMFNVDGDLGQYNKEFWSWKHNYRKRYSEEKMSIYGYKPIVMGMSAEESLDEVNAFMLSKDASYSKAIDVYVGYPDLYSTMANYLQWNGYDYSIKKQELNVSGTIYSYTSVGYGENPDPAIEDDYTVGVGTFTAEDSSVYTVEFPNAFYLKTAFKVLYIRDAFETESSEYYIYMDYPENVPLLPQP